MANRELAATKAYVRGHPFPAKFQIAADMEATWGRAYDQGNGLLGRIMEDVYARFTQDQMMYLDLKECYENIMDRAACIRVGQRLHTRVGFHGMQAVVYMMGWVSPLAKAQNPVVRAQANNLNYYWDGIGHWRA